jgi:uncharacterized LabA/DUF88 family protein
MEPRTARPLQLALAVDGHSMFYAQQKLGWFFDPRRLLAYANRQPAMELGSAFWYAGLKDPTDQRPFRDALASMGYTVRTRPLRELPGGSSDFEPHRQPDARNPDPRPGEPRLVEPRHGEQRHYVRANLDVEIAIDLLCVAPRTDEVWLLSGSKDLERLLEVLRAQGLRTTVITTDGMVARELRNAADRFVEMAGLRQELEKSEALHQPVFLRGDSGATPSPRPRPHPATVELINS